jgi:hypothetical protein
MLGSFICVRLIHSSRRNNTAFGPHLPVPLYSPIYQLPAPNKGFGKYVSVSQLFSNVVTHDPQRNAKKIRTRSWFA